MKRFFKNKNVCRFCEKEMFSNKIKDDCHLTGKHRGLSHQSCEIKVTQKKPKLFHLYFTI